MKKNLMITLLAMLTVSPALAQYSHRSQRYGRSVPSVRSSYHYNSHRSYHDPYTYYGLRLGLGVSTVNSNDRYLDGGTAKAGLGLGVIAGVYMPASPISLETGLFYTEKGGKGNNGGEKFTYGMNYLEVPVVMKYQCDIDGHTSIQPFFGVYGAVGVSGEIKDFQHRQAYSSFDNDAFRRFDGGLRLGCGLQFDRLYAEVGYDVGLSNVSHDNFDTAHTGCFFANIGVNF